MTESELEKQFEETHKRLKKETLRAWSKFCAWLLLAVFLITSLFFIFEFYNKDTTPIVKETTGATELECLGTTARVLVVTNSGHRFAIVCYDGRVGICEATEASKTP